MARRWCLFVAHQWRFPKLMWVLIALEVPLVIAVLALFGIADPDTYRSKLWQNGSDQGFNSNPNEILYAYANYEPIHVPLVWSSLQVHPPPIIPEYTANTNLSMTKFNIVISVLTVFILLVKSMMYVLNAFIPLLSVFVHALMIALYAVSVRNQASPDLSNTKVPHLSRNLPWYLSKGCSYATQKNKGYCMQARASFAVTCVILALFVVYFALALYSTIPTAAEKSARQADYDEEFELKQARYTLDPDAGLSKEEKWERNRQIFLNLPKTPNTPGFGQGPYGAQVMTPRTTAFGRLTGETSQAGGGGLALRDRWDGYGEVRVPDPI